MRRLFLAGWLRDGRERTAKGGLPASGSFFEESCEKEPGTRHTLFLAVWLGGGEKNLFDAVEYPQYPNTTLGLAYRRRPDLPLLTPLTIPVLPLSFGIGRLTNWQRACYRRAVKAAVKVPCQSAAKTLSKL